MQPLTHSQKMRVLSRPGRSEAIIDCLGDASQGIPGDPAILAAEVLFGRDTGYGVSRTGVFSGGHCNPLYFIIRACHEAALTGQPLEISDRDRQELEAGHLRSAAALNSAWQSEAGQSALRQVWQGLSAGRQEQIERTRKSSNPPPQPVTENNLYTLQALDCLYDQILAKATNARPDLLGIAELALDAVAHLLESK